MCGHQVTLERPSDDMVHTFCMHHFFYGYTLIEMVIVLMLLPFLFMPLFLIGPTSTPLDDVIQFKKTLYQSDVQCMNHQLTIDDSITNYDCETIQKGISITYQSFQIYYVKS